MSTYLKIAYSVLKASKRPMTAAAILKSAYAAEIVPIHLYGKTQTKTLQARLSEDILHRPTSAFYRTEPGYYFLTEFLEDPEIPEKFKIIFHARRRKRDLKNPPYLIISADFLQNCDEYIKENWLDFATLAEASDAIRYNSSQNSDMEFVPVWTFSIVRRGSSVLTYRTGRYRSGNDNFANKRSIGFSSLISFFDCTLFSDGDFGASENATVALSSDLDISAATFEDDDAGKPRPRFVISNSLDLSTDVVLVIMDWDCPDWFEPTTRRLSINNLEWMDLSILPNNIDDFEPWSQSALLKLRKIVKEI